MFSTWPAAPARAWARSSVLPPSVWMRPLNFSATSRWSSLRRLNSTRPSPSTSTCTALAAARPTRPAWMLPPTLSCGATSATVPPGAAMLPSACRPPAPGPALKRYSPARKAASDRSSVEATRPPTFTCEPRPKTMPRGLSRKTWPLDAMRPRISDGSPPTTRLSSTELTPGCSMRSDSWAPMEKLCQLMTALSLACWISPWPACGVDTLTCPCATWAPCGKPCAAG